MSYVIQPVDSYNVYVIKGEMLGEPEYIADGCDIQEAYHFFFFRRSRKSKRINGKRVFRRF